MKIVLIIEYIINLGLLLIFNMYMFQLNSYAVTKHVHWIKANLKKVLTQIIFALIPTILIIIDNNVINIISGLILAISIIYNIPRGKSKIKFKVTNRVKRMFITELILVFLSMIINGLQSYTLLKLGILNIIAFIMCMVANTINKPIEKYIQKRFINQAKKIINDMPNLLVIGVTGSYGKTSVKNYLAKTLSTKYEVLATPKNYNTTMGVVKTIRENLKPTHQIFICEMGATKTGDIKEICDIVNPKIGIITAIGPQHLETFKTMENIMKTKFELADKVKENGGKVFLNFNNEYLAKKKHEDNEILYGIENPNIDYNAYGIEASSKGLRFKVKDNNEEVEFYSKLIGKHNVINFMAAISVANHLGVSIKKMVPKIREIESVEHRLQLIPHGKLTVIDDTYNSNPISSKCSIDTLSEFKGTKVIITPGLIELGKDEEKYNFDLGTYMAEVCDYIYLVGEKHSKPIYDGVLSKKFNKEKIFIVESPQEAMQMITKLNVEGEVTVLLENDLPDNYNL